MLHFHGNLLLKQRKQTMAVLQIFRRHDTQGGGEIMQRKVFCVFLNRSYTFSMLIVVVDWIPSLIKSSTSMLNERETK